MTWTQHALHNVVSCWVWEWNKCCCVCDTDSTTALSVIIIRCLRSVNMRHKDGIFCNFLCMLYRGLSVCVFIWASLYLYWHCIPRGLDKITLPASATKIICSLAQMHSRLNLYVVVFWQVNALVCCMNLQVYCHPKKYLATLVCDFVCDN